MKDLICIQQNRTSTIEDKNGNNLTELQEVIGRWTEYCSELYNHNAAGDPNGLDVPPNDNLDQGDDSILRAEVEEAIKALKKGK